MEPSNSYAAGSAPGTEQAREKIADAARAVYGLIRPLLGPRACRFHPTCSEYTFQSFKRYGLFKGALLSVRRIVRCHPWNPGGYDPVR